MGNVCISYNSKYNRLYSGKITGTNYSTERVSSLMSVYILDTPRITHCIEQKA